MLHTRAPPLYRAPRAARAAHLSGGSPRSLLTALAALTRSLADPPVSSLSARAQIGTGKDPGQRGQRDHLGGALLCGSHLGYTGRAPRLLLASPAAPRLLLASLAAPRLLRLACSRPACASLACLLLLLSLCTRVPAPPYRATLPPSRSCAHRFNPNSSPPLLLIPLFLTPLFLAPLLLAALRFAALQLSSSKVAVLLLKTGNNLYFVISVVLVVLQVSYEAQHTTPLLRHIPHSLPRRC